MNEVEPEEEEEEEGGSDGWSLNTTPCRVTPPLGTRGPVNGSGGGTAGGRRLRVGGGGEWRRGGREMLVWRGGVTVAALFAGRFVGKIDSIEWKVYCCM